MTLVFNQLFGCPMRWYPHCASQKCSYISTPSSLPSFRQQVHLVRLTMLYPVLSWSFPAFLTNSDSSNTSLEHNQTDFRPTLLRSRSLTASSCIDLIVDAVQCAVYSSSDKGKCWHGSTELFSGFQTLKCMFQQLLEVVCSTTNLNMCSRLQVP